MPFDLTTNITAEITAFKTLIAQLVNIAIDARSIVYGRIEMTEHITPADIYSVEIDCDHDLCVYTDRGNSSVTLSVGLPITNAFTIAQFKARQNHAAKEEIYDTQVRLIKQKREAQLRLEAEKEAARLKEIALYRSLKQKYGDIA